MRLRATLALLILLGSACAEQAPTRPGVDVIDRSGVIADQLEDREADLEELIGNLGG